MITALVIGLSGGGHGMQILKALQMSDLDIRIIGANNTEISYGKSFLDTHYLLPSANEPDYLEKLIEILKKEKVDVLFHGSEPELKVFSQNRDELEKHVFLPINSSDVIDTCMDKMKTMRFLSENGFNYPRFHLIEKLEDIEDVKKFPLVCKPHVGSGGSNNTFIAQDAEDLELVSRYLLKYVESFIAQEYVGNADTEYTVGVLSDMDGNLVDSIAVKRQLLTSLSTRIRMRSSADPGETLIVSSGVSQGDVGRYPEVTTFCEKIAEKIKSKGPLNIQCRIVDGDVYIFEINPRYSGTTPLRAMVGFNEPELLIRKHLLGEQIGKIDYKPATILRGLEERKID